MTTSLDFKINKNTILFGKHIDGIRLTSNGTPYIGWSLNYMVKDDKHKAKKVISVLLKSTYSNLAAFIGDLEYQKLWDIADKRITLVLDDLKTIKDWYKMTKAEKETLNNAQNKLREMMKNEDLIKLF